MFNVMGGVSVMFKVMGDGVRGAIVCHSHVQGDGRGVRGASHVQGDRKGDEGRQPCSR